MTEPTRFETLKSIQLGTLKIKRYKDFKGYIYDPVSHTINAGWLERARMIQVDPEFVVVELTDWGRQTIDAIESRITARAHQDRELATVDR